MRPTNFVDYVPNELLIGIFNLLPKDSQGNCLCVCKSWYYVFAYIHYRNITIGDRDEQDKIALFARFLKERPPNVGGGIRTLQINQRPSRLCTEKEAKSARQALGKILVSCNNLKELGMTVDSQYWKYMYELSQEPHIPKLHKISALGMITHRHRQDYFYKVAHQHRSTLKKLDVHRSCDQSIQKEFHGLLNYLKDFKQLERLSIKSGSQQELIFFHRLLEVCPQLEALDYQLDHPFFDCNPTNVSIYPTLRELDIYLPDFSSRLLKYVTERFQSLKRLTIRVNHSDSTQQSRWSKSETGDTLTKALYFFGNQFISFIRQLEYSQLNFCINGKSYIEPYIAQIYCSQISMNSKEVNADFQLTDSRAEMSQMTLIKGVDNVDFRFHFVREFDSLQHDLLYLEHLRSYGSRLQKLKITYNRQDGLATAIDLNPILSLCPNLSTLSISIQASPSVYFSHPHASIFPPLILSEAAQTVDPHIAHVVLEGMSITPEFLKNLSVRLPNMRSFVIRNCIASFESNQFYDMSCLDIESFQFDISTHQRARVDDRESFCFVLERKFKRTLKYYLVNETQPKELTESQFNERKGQLPVIWFMFNTLKKAELHATNKALCAKEILFCNN
ncbi:hypothetical protein A0J61_01389 [Choanephora cucurbitarum]|uniref:F-box domain-containing protein n=1 Tax=Choanephora cucurbitarum TaxID=101091 RepID=A0A1C7NN42_9FUNG|nr:hypothetical protein A0J61_01389 [Choanephora cucurbitarum]